MVIQESKSLFRNPFEAIKPGSDNQVGWGPCSPEVMICNVTKASVRLGECSVIRGGRWLREMEVGVKEACYFFSV